VASGALLEYQVTIDTAGSSETLV
jgi:hypothetical protein